MHVIPAIDLYEGRCVRLLRGDERKKTVYSDNPAEMAVRWEAEGAMRLHVVDLNGAFQGRPVNSRAVAAIADRVNIPVQLGGGMRDRQTVENTFELGVDKVILGTAAVENGKLVRELVHSYGEKVIVGIDARDGMVAVKGWVQGSEKEAVQFALQMQGCGVKEIIYTDISRDGTLEGPNLESLAKMAAALSIPLVASGGVSSLEDLFSIKKMQHMGISGVIVGQALYTGKFTLKEAVAKIEKR